MSDQEKKKAAPRAYTEDEVREQVLRHVCGVIRYWQAEKRSTPDDRVAGAVFSVLVMLDGCAAALPGFKVTPDPHPSDAAYHREHGENWWPEDVDIAGHLHERMYPTLRGETP